VKIFFRTWLAIAVIAVLPARPAAAQSDDWKISIYPVLAWVPIEIGIDVNVPPISGGGGTGPEFGGKIIDGRLDGAFFGGVAASKAGWRFDVDGLWAGVGGDRFERPSLRVDVDMLYGHASAGREIAGSDFYITGGVRRIALNYDIDVNGLQFDRKPGVWDPLIGVGYHRETGGALDFHATFEGGGFGVGSEVDLSGGVRVDWKPFTHFGFAAGYNVLYFELSNTVLDRTFTAKQTLHGPVVGIGLYF
jgi:hypothetical protein